jgi:hypothetical protein
MTLRAGRKGRRGHASPRATERVVQRVWWRGAAWARGAGVRVRQAGGRRRPRPACSLELLLDGVLRRREGHPPHRVRVSRVTCHESRVTSYAAGFAPRARSRHPMTSRLPSGSLFSERCEPSLPPPGPARRAQRPPARTAPTRRSRPARARSAGTTVAAVAAQQTTSLTPSPPHALPLLRTACHNPQHPAATPCPARAQGPGHAPAPARPRGRPPAPLPTTAPPAAAHGGAACARSAHPRKTPPTRRTHACTARSASAPAVCAAARCPAALRGAVLALSSPRASLCSASSARCASSSARASSSCRTRLRATAATWLPPRPSACTPAPASPASAAGPAGDSVALAASAAATRRASCTTDLRRAPGPPPLDPAHQPVRPFALVTPASPNVATYPPHVPPGPTNPRKHSAAPAQPRSLSRTNRSPATARCPVRSRPPQRPTPAGSWAAARPCRRPCSR